MDDYVTYEQAVNLKKAGFHEKCENYYTREDAPDNHVWITSGESIKDYNSQDESLHHSVVSATTKELFEKWMIGKEQ